MSETSCSANVTNLPSLTERTIEGVLLVIINIVAVATNVLFWITVLSYHNLRTTANCLLLCLSTADLLMCFSMPVTAYTIFLGRWTLSCAVCKMTGVVLLLTMTAGMASLCSISINRYIRVCHVTWYNVIYNRKCIGLHIAVIWTTSSIPAFGSLLGWGEYNFIHQTFLCGVVDNNSMSLQIYMTFVCYVGTVVIMTFCYVAIFRKFFKTRLLMFTQFQHRQREKDNSSWSYLLHLQVPADWWNRRVSGPTESFSSNDSSTFLVASANVAASVLAKQNHTIQARATALNLHKKLPSRYRSLAKIAPQLSEITEITDSEITNPKPTHSKSIGGRKSSDGTLNFASSEDMSTNNLYPNDKVTESDNSEAAESRSCKDNHELAGRANLSGVSENSCSKSSELSSGRSFLAFILPIRKNLWPERFSTPASSTTTSKILWTKPDEAAYRETVRVTSAILAIVLAFFLSFLPIFILPYINGVPPQFSVAAVLMSFANSMYNPFLYGWGNNHIRKGYMKVLRTFRNYLCCKRRKHMRRVG